MFLTWPILTPIRRCGEHSLQIFCLGTFLLLTAEIIVAYLTTLSFHRSLSALPGSP
ncbi:OpgC domain-containing protein [Reyranella sp.]|uniref:OpgC domain-containing protein n=1 Tax=Reyranella sp. TaxID=1929291 RepID=UPI0039C9A6FC